MSVRKIRNSWWVDFRFEGVRHRKRSPENSQGGAKAYEALLRQRLARGEPVDGQAKNNAEVPTFAEFADRWMQTYVMTNNRPTTVLGKRCTLRKHLLPAFGTRCIDRVGHAEIEAYKAAKLAAGLSPQTINTQLLILHQCLQTAADWSVITAAPRIKSLKVPPSRPAFLTPEEVARLLAAAEGSSLRDMILMAARTGMRIGELLALDWSDVDLQKGTVTVRRNLVLGKLLSPKNNRIRELPITNDLAAALIRRHPRSGLVFAQASGRPLGRQFVSDNLSRVCRRAGLRPVGWHALRHTFASHLAMRGISLRVVQELLGHANITMTERYSHLTPTTLGSVRK
jgi:integrase